MAIADLKNVLKLFGESSDDGQDKDLLAEVMLMTLARASSADANIDPVEVSTILRIMERETGEGLTEADVRKAARRELYEDANLRKYLRSVRGKLSSPERARIALALAEVIKSDTSINVLEIDFFNRVADALSLSPVELVGLNA